MLPRHLVRIVNPNGGVVYKRIVEEQFSNNQLLERILSTENVGLAWKQVRANKGAPGIDDITIEEFPFTFRECWPEIRSTLLEGNYTPSSVQRVEIPKPDGSTRPLGIPSRHFLQIFFLTIWTRNWKNVVTIRSLEERKEIFARLPRSLCR